MTHRHATIFSIRLPQLAAALSIAASLLAAHPATAAESVSENRPVDARVQRVSLGGVINLRVRQGATASLVVTGDKRDLDDLRIRQDGERLQIDMDSSWQRDRRRNDDRNRPELRAELTVPNLAEVASHGVGMTEISGFTSDEMALRLDGAGSMTVAGSIRKLRADLAGAGSMTLKPGEADRIDLNLSGAGQIVVSGQSKLLHARLGGVGSLDARQLRADSVELDMTGLGSANVFARSAANLNLSGMGSASIAGKPAQRKVSTSGLGSVSWD